MPLTDNLISYYPLDGNSNDAVVGAGILNEDFNALNNGDLATQNGWVDGTNTAYNTNVSVASAYEGAKGVDFSVAGTGSGQYCSVKKQGIGVVNGSLSFYSYHTRTTDTSWFWLGEYAVGAGEGENIEVVFDPSGNVKIDANGGATTTIGTYSINTWYLTEIQWHNNPSKEFRVRFNGGSWSSWIAFTYTTTIDTVEMMVEVIPSGTPHHYFDYIVSTSSNNGTDTDITYSAGNGKIVQGAGFNGTTSKIILGTPIAKPTDFTISAWVKTPNTSVINTIFCDANVGATVYYDFRINIGGKIAFNYADVSNEIDYTTDAAQITDTNWHFVTITKVGTGAPTFYVDGSPVASSKTYGTTEPTLTAQGTAIGVVGLSVFDPYLGSIDEVGIWSRALSSGEVSQLWNGGAGLAYPLVTNVVYTMVTAPASFAYTPVSVTPTKLMHLITDKANYILTGMSSGLKRSWTMITSSATFTLTTMGVGFKKIMHLITAPATYTLAGIAVGINKSLTMVTAPAKYILTGSVITFTKIFGKIVDWLNPHAQDYPKSKEQSYPKAKEIPYPQSKNNSKEIK